MILTLVKCTLTVLMNFLFFIRCFPDLERTMRVVDLKEQIAPNAIIPRYGLPKIEHIIIVANHQLIELRRCSES